MITLLSLAQDQSNEIKGVKTLGILVLALLLLAFALGKKR